MSVSATQAGHGGTISTHSLGKTTLNGTLLAQGGKSSGNGGFINTGSSLLEIGSSLSVIAGSRGDGSVGTWNIIASSLGINLNNAKVISAALDRANVNMKLVKSYCASYGGCDFSMTPGLIFDPGAVISKSSSVNSQLAFDSEGQLTIAGNINSSETAPLDLILKSSESVLLETSAKIGVRQAKIEAPAVSVWGDLASYGGEGQMPWIAILAGRLLVTGTIRANSRNNVAGRIYIHSDNEVLLNHNGVIAANGDDGGEVDVSSDGIISILGTIQTNGSSGRGGTIHLEAQNDILIQDASLMANGSEGGSITHISNSGNLVVQNSTIQTNGSSGRGGTIAISGYNNTLINNSTISSVGYTQGGRILIGYDEKDQTLPFSKYASIDSQTVVSTNSMLEVGGVIETSAHVLNLLGTINAGRGGIWLIDPYNVTIGASASGTSYSSPYTTFTPSATSQILASNIQTALNAGSSVTISTGSSGSDAGDITVSSAISKTAGGNAVLTLTASGSVIINNTISSSSGTLGLTVTATNGSFSGTGNLSLNGGALSVTQATSGTYSGILSGTGTTLTKLGAGTLTLSGDNSYTGNTTVTAGTLQVGNAGSTGRIGSGNIINNEILPILITIPR